MKVRPEACTWCPYRRDVPSGVWAHEEYEKLRDYDAPTAEQPMASFACHASPQAYCHGWAVVHMNRGADPNNPLSVHPYDLIALRMAEAMGHWDGVLPPASTPLFASGNEAADHGERDIDNPSPEANVAVERLQSKHPRLRGE